MNTEISVYFLVFGGPAKKAGTNNLILEQPFEQGQIERKVFNKIVKIENKNKSYKIEPNEDSVTFREIVDLINKLGKNKIHLQNLNFTAQKSGAFITDLGSLANKIATESAFSDVSAHGIICCPIAFVCAQNTRDIIGDIKIDFRFIGASRSGIAPMPFIFRYKYPNSKKNPYEKMIEKFFLKIDKLAIYSRQYVNHVTLAEAYVNHFNEKLNNRELANILKNSESTNKITRD